ncbi:MAG TPA: hypothetical protein VIF61_00415 [Methylocystis sp.]|jgi:hypothetical protein
MPSPPPSADNDYAVTRATVLDDATLNAILGSIGARLRAREALEASFQALIDSGVSQAIGVVQTELEPYAAEAQSKTAQIAAYLAAYQADANPLVETVRAAVIGSVASRGDTLAKLLALIDANSTGIDGLTTALALKAPLDSPALIGSPTAPTAAPGTNTTQLATTAFVAAALSALVNGAPGALDTLKELADALGDDANFASTMTAALANRLRIDAAQGLSAAQIAQARANISLGPMVTVRQTVSAGPVDTNGLPTLFPASSGSLSISTQNVSSSSPLIATAAQGFDAYGKADYVFKLAANQTWAGLPANSTVYLYINAQTGALGFLTLQPIYQFGGTPSVANGQFTFNISEMKGYLGNGSSAPAAPLVIVGEVVTNASTVTSAVAYAYNGLYDSGWTATLTGTATSKNSNIGLQPDIVFMLAECTTADNGYAVGDQMTFLSQPSYGNQLSIWKTRNQVGFAGTGTYSASNKSSSAGVNLTVGSWKWKLIAKRGW